MERYLLDAVAVFTGVTVALAAAIGVGIFWARRRIRMFRARLIMRVASGELTVGNFITTIRINRHGVTTAMVRRRLRVNVDGAVTAVHAAERAGAPIGELGTLAADLEAAAHSLDEAMASMGASGVTSVVLARAEELSGSARQLRRAAERLLAATAVPGHAELVESIGSIDGVGATRRSTRWNLLAR